MKETVILISLGLLAIGLVGCENDDEVVIINDPAPATPQGVFSVTGDQSVWIWWNGIYERDVMEYLVYRSLDPVDEYVQIATVPAVDNPNLDLLIYNYRDVGRTNGVTYWYAVASVDFAGQVSELSAEEVFDTPRPQGQASMLPNDISGLLSGFNFQTGINVWDTSLAADVWVDRVFLIDGNDTTVISYLNAGNIYTDLQDLGYTYDFDEISFAPDSGWSMLGYMELVEGHTYVIWTADNNYAKLRAVSMSSSGAVSFQWAYQTDSGNRELAPGLKKPEHDEEYLKTRKR